MWNITAHIHFQQKLTYHSWYCTRLGGAQCLDHLEHVHYSLCLTAINHSGHGTEHTTTSHCVTREKYSTLLDNHTSVIANQCLSRGIFQVCGSWYGSVWRLVSSPHYINTNEGRFACCALIYSHNNASD